MKTRVTEPRGPTQAISSFKWFILPSRHVGTVQQPWRHILRGFSVLNGLRRLRLHCWLFLPHSCRETLSNGEIYSTLGRKNEGINVNNEMKELCTYVTQPTCPVTAFILARVFAACFKPITALHYVACRVRCCQQVLGKFERGRWFPEFVQAGGCCEVIKRFSNSWHELVQ